MSVLKKNDQDIAFNGYGRREKYEKTSGKYCLDLRNIIGFYVKWLRKENSRCNRRHNCHSGEQQCGRDNHSGEGEGLLFYGNVILPFVDRFPTDLELYRIMTTKLTEVKEAKEA